ncbi:MAG: hypothetical protein HUJ30_04870 [Gammaproteobacteria bacterium]|nr:hypothetical protein [Gammaproteobacteria bacterium]
MEIYSFKGKINPVRSGINCSKTKHKAYSPEINLEYDVEFEIKESQVNVTISSDGELTKPGVRYIACVSEMARAVIEAYLDTYGFIAGIGFEVEIEDLLDDGEWVSLQYTVPILENRNRNIDAEMIRLNKLYNNPNSWHLQQCFGDLRRAIRHVNDTGYYCYRAIESLASFFKDDYAEQMKTQTWNKFNEIVGIDKSITFKIKKYADASRHGSVIPMPSDLRGEIFKNTWEIVDRFILFAENGYGGLNSPIHKMTK